MATSVPTIPLGGVPASSSSAATAPPPAAVRDDLMASSALSPRAMTEVYVSGLDDPRIADLLRGGHTTASGAVVNADTAMRVTAVMACVRIIAGTTGMLPLHLLDESEEGKPKKARDHKLYKVLYRRPNRWQTAMEFRAMLTAHLLLRGNGYAYIVRSRGIVQELLPLHPDRVEPKQLDDLSIVYKYTRRNGGTVEFKQSDIFHLRDLTCDGIVGMSRIAQAREAIGLAMQAEKAGAKLFKQGNLLGGILSTEAGLSDKARTNVKTSLEENFAGGENAGKWLVLEEGLEPKEVGLSAADLQFIETRRFQVEDIGRIFGVPPHMIGAVDKTTSWGQGILNQGNGFVQFTMQPHFTTWEQTIVRDLLTDAEADFLYPKYNVAALMRGSAKDRAEYLKAALGAGGSRPWMKQNEARALEDLPRDDDPDSDRLMPPTNSQVKPAAGAAAGADDDDDTRGERDD